jgi:hypothetical protein
LAEEGGIDNRRRKQEYRCALQKRTTRTELLRKRAQRDGEEHAACDREDLDHRKRRQQRVGERPQRQQIQIGRRVVAERLSENANGPGFDDVPIPGQEKLLHVGRIYAPRNHMKADGEQDQHDPLPHRQRPRAAIFDAVTRIQGFLPIHCAGYASRLLRTSFAASNAGLIGAIAPLTLTRSPAIGPVVRGGLDLRSPGGQELNIAQRREGPAGHSPAASLRALRSSKVTRKVKASCRRLTS